jgi:hypothetical protein
MSVLHDYNLYSNGEQQFLPYRSILGDRLFWVLTQTLVARQSFLGLGGASTRSGWADPGFDHRGAKKAMIRIRVAQNLCKS